MALAEPVFGLGSAARRQFQPLNDYDLRYQRPNSEDSSSERGPADEEEQEEDDDDDEIV